jgi:hypothetical protein
MIRNALLAAFAVFALSAPAHASEMPHAWVGGLFGLAVPNYDNTTSRGAYGLTAGAKLGDNLGVGVYYISSQKNENLGKFNYDLFGVQFSFHFDGEATGAWFGGRIGTSKVDTGSSYSPMNYGLVGGYDYLFIPQASIGGEVSWMSISQSAPLNSFSSLNFLAALKFWF